MQERSGSGAPTLVIDLDGTLTPTDTLVESIVALVRRQPWRTPVILYWLLFGRAGFKARIAAAHRLNVHLLPWRQDLVEWIRAQRASGRRVVLATAAHRQIADDVALAQPLFDEVLASEPGLNLKGLAKLAAIRQQVGDEFVYAGDSRADLPIWSAARAAVLVGVDASVARQVRASGAVEREFAPLANSLSVWLKAVRAHQWLKNLLLFVPLLTSFGFTDPKKVLAMLAAFIAFSLAASATYLLNDLWDLDNDRQHARKRQRPLASGRLPLVQGLLGSVALMIAALGVALLATPWPFAAMLLGYVVLTTSYSWVLKAYVLMDVLVLALLYTYRVLAGAVAIGLVMSPWLLAFSVFTFLSLALVKRCAELVGLRDEGKLQVTGRDYRVSDLSVLWPLGVGASLCAAVVFGLFIGSPEARQAYGDTSTLWLVGVGLIYWMARMWIKTSRGEMHDDPIVFAIRDRGSRVAVAAMCAVPLLSHLLRW